MPYPSVEKALETQPGLEKYSKRAQEAWVKAFNSAYEQYKDESRAFATAYSVANKIDSFKEWLTLR